MMNFFKNLFSSKSGSADEEDRSDDIEYLMEHAKSLIRGGYYSREDAINALDDWIQDDGLNLSAKKIINAEIDSLKLDQVNWPAQTDYDRLHATMQQLENNGVVAREDFTCCGTCGTAEIGYEIETYNEGDKTATGYTFFHQQDTESAVGGYGLYLNYGTADKDGTDDDSIKIGHEIAKTFKDNGFEVDWDGDLRKRIHIALDWKRRWAG